MPLNQDGMRTEFHGDDVYQQLADKIDQLRRDMRHIQAALQTIEAQIRRSQRSHPVKPLFVQGSFKGGDEVLPAAVADSLKPMFYNLHNWTLSALESYYSMSWVVYGRDKVSEVVRDVEAKFKSFISGRSIRSHR